MKKTVNCSLMKSYLLGTEGFEKDYKTAISYLIKSIEAGECPLYYEIITSQGLGQNIEEPIYILEEKNGVQVEYTLIEAMQGQQGIDWFVVSQKIQNIDGRYIDQINIETVKGNTISYYFDITRSFGK